MKKTINYLMSGVIAAAVLTFAGCSKKSEPLPAINGYETSNDVAAINLLAHWTFDNTKNETISATAPIKDSANSYVTGIKGQALSLANGYLVYPTIASISGPNAFPSLTVSLWFNNVVDNGTTATNLFGIAQASTTAVMDWNTGPCNLYLETSSHKAGSDTIVLHADIQTWVNDSTRLGGDNLNNYGVAGTDWQYVFGGNWIHYVAVYDGTASTINVYANNVLVSNVNFALRKWTPPGTVTAVGIGPIINKTATQAIVGQFARKSTGFPGSANQTFQGTTTASIDEIRVYSKALSTVEIGSLYKLELVGR